MKIFFCTGSPKSAVRGCKQKFVEQKISKGYPQPKFGKSQEFSGMDCLKNFLIKGKNLNYFCNGGPKFCERGLTKFIGASATKSWEKSRSFRYGVSEDGKP